MFDPGLKLAKVAAVYPDGHSIDVVFYDDGSRASNVQVISGSASTSTGFHDLPSPATPPGGDKWSMQDSKSRDMIAVIGFVRGQPIAMGFLYPQVNQMLFADKNRMVYRHASGVYFTITGSGDCELCHPSGAFVRFGANAAHEDLTGKDLDGNWNIPAASPVNIHVEQAGGTASVNIDTSGKIDVNSAASVKITAPTITLKGAIVLDGTITQANTGGGASTATMIGPVTVTNDVTAGGKSLMHHVHSGVQSGGGNTGQPV